MTAAHNHQRTGGILLHPTSLPGPHGIGSLGPDARRFAEAIAEMGLSWWQMLPIGPTGYGDSPYQSSSTFAGNPLLISFDDLVEDRLMTAAEADDHPSFPADHVDFGPVISHRMRLLGSVTSTFFRRADDRLRDSFDAFVERHGSVWLHDFALFTALKRERSLAPWWEWEPEIRSRQNHALTSARSRLDQNIRAVLIEQFLFDRHFTRLRSHSTDHGVRFIGDIPIFVAHDSADVWANPELFYLDSEGMPTAVAGVPPDYFSETGQRWGNPLYAWDRHRADGFAWWKARLGRLFEMFDLVRIDHFRGFAASWHIPASEPTAIVGEWVEAPGTELFDGLTATFGVMPVIAEDLGVITDDVEELRDRYGFPGMKVLQFGFGTESAHALEEFRENVVAYTGTHDNDTAAGWWRDPSPDREAEHELASEILGIDETSTDRDVAWAMIEALFDSIAGTAIVPLQDILGLGSEARMNTPAIEAGNWRWRFEWDQMESTLIERMRTLATATQRMR